MKSDVPSANWDLVAAIPGVSIPESVEAGSTAAVPYNDPRYQQLKKNPGVRQYLDSFRNPFGVPLKPTIIIRKTATTPILGSELVGFRNAFALSALVESRVQTQQRQWLMSARYAEFFAFYPVHLSRDGKRVFIESPVETGMHKLSKFTGQPWPVSVNPKHIFVSFDQYLLKALLELWVYPKAKGKFRSFRTRVFRSLEMAFHGLHAPFSNLGSKTDHGLMLSLWVSAFEILARPPTRSVTFKNVSEMIRSVPWHNPKLRKTRYRPIDTRSKRQRIQKGPLLDTTLPVQIYGRLYRARNDYLHGNPLPTNGVEPRKRKAWRNLDTQIPVLYRSVVLHLLASHGFGKFPRKLDLSKLYSAGIDKENIQHALKEYQSNDNYEQPLTHVRS